MITRRLFQLVFSLVLLVAFSFAGKPQELTAEEAPKEKAPELTNEEWAYQAMVAFANPEKAPQFAGHEETVEQTKERYRGIAAAIAAATTSRDRVALLVALGIGESRLSRDTDLGPCYRGKIGGGLWSRCDHGTSGSVWQVKTPVIGPDGETVRYEDTFKDRTRAAKIALRLAVGSLGACRHLEPVDHLSALGGKCAAGFEPARQRYRLWQKIRVWNPPAK